MDILKKLIVFSGVLSIGVFCNLPALSGDWSEAEKEVWQLEEQYWECWKNGDIEEIMALYHRDFVGWPSSSKEPVNKESGREFLEELLSRTKFVAVELKPHAIKIFGDVAIVHYSLSWIGKDSEGNKQSGSSRITHTWLKQDDRWRLIGGMSAD